MKKHIKHQLARWLHKYYQNVGNYTFIVSVDHQVEDNAVALDREREGAHEGRRRSCVLLQRPSIPVQNNSDLDSTKKRIRRYGRHFLQQKLPPSIDGHRQNQIDSHGIEFLADDDL